MDYERSSGILLHPTSLPSPYGIGDIGPEARKWIDFLASTGSHLWQILPLGPTGYGDSPYQCFSAFAGNPLLISPDELIEDGLLLPNALNPNPPFPLERVDFSKVIPYKLTILKRSFQHFRKSSPHDLQVAFDEFRQKERHWLDDFTLFMAIKNAHQGVSWEHWPLPLKNREPKALQRFRKKHQEAIERHAYYQFVFHHQWQKLKQYANAKQVKIIGDVPIFIAHDSADVWAHPNLFHLDKNGQPTVVAGVPPDYFSPTGQRWGNPLYRWDVHAKQNYAWWIQRLSSLLELVDILRLDHFRGFAAYWEIPADEPTAVHGKWVNGPGNHFFDKLIASLGDIPILAEDLGMITPQVVAMRDQYKFPGMKILLFAFSGDANNPFLPHNYTRNYVAYTGTHDNDTVVGWFNRIQPEEREFVMQYLATDGKNITWDMIRAVWSSVAVIAIAPLQDVLGLDNSARMNYPSKASGNWTWRMHPQAITPTIQKKLAKMNRLYGRTNPT